ncbi:MAG: SIS domain-containing protein [Selenomonadaceae bacterium]|nr:SIS domain-containing protein [Selenomonadaceae bacterium]
MNLSHIIVQAGGKGSRMERLTRNKPKALVPVNNLPMIFHLFKKFPDKKFIIIGDYKFDVLEKYLREFATVDYELVRGTGNVGTCAGISDSLAKVPNDVPFLLIWCDLILSDEHKLLDTDKNVIGISQDFSCRWSYRDGKFFEEPSDKYGVAGYFVFQNKNFLADVPASGEFVRWLQSKNFTFEEQPLKNTKEYGLYSEWSKLPRMRCRPFNQITVDGDKIIKQGIDEQGRELAKKEIAWYKKIQGENFSNIPTIYEYEPLTMEFIDGQNIYEYNFIPDTQKRYLLKKIIACLQEVHKLGSVKADKESYFDAYIGKTYKRLEKVRNLVPFANDETITINGRVCRNIFYHKDECERLVMQYLPEEFKLIHGDCTFSNMMLRHDTEPVLIDPRGYFGHIQFYGDVAYDWVKLYYSLLSNYDRFNLKRFSLEIGDKDVSLKIESNDWENLEEYFFELLDGEVTKRQMKLLLAITWLSLTTYTWEDYDSICGAFYNGLYYLEEALQMESAYGYFAQNMSWIENALKSISGTQMDALISDCEKTLRGGHRIIVSGLGKNVPICEKFVGTMISMGLDASFMHTNSAVHGDMGIIRACDLVIILTKSGETEESIYLTRLLQRRNGVHLRLLTFKDHSTLADMIPKKLVIHLDNEGDLWNVLPNNSTTLNLIVLQTVAIEVARRMQVDLEKDFKPNHPGGAIGRSLNF